MVLGLVYAKAVQFNIHTQYAFKGGPPLPELQWAGKRRRRDVKVHLLSWCVIIAKIVIITSLWPAVPYEVHEVNKDQSGPKIMR